MVRHCDPDVLALRALGEPAGSVADESHLAECEQCRRELEDLRAVVTTGREIGPDDLPQSPPAHVWSAVAAELGLSTSQPRHGAGPVDAVIVTGEPTVSSVATEDRLAGRFSPLRRRVLLLAAAVAGIGIGVAGTLAVTGTTGAPAETVIAEAQLAPLPGWSAEGSAEVVESDGRRTLHLSLAGAQVPSGYREVWLLDAQAERLVSLGFLTGEEGDFALPEGLDLDAFPVVDVSHELYDGDPAHSGDSVVRGRLDV